VRILPKDSHQKLKISYADIAALAFTGRDTAAGKVGKPGSASTGRKRAPEKAI